VTDGIAHATGTRDRMRLAVLGLLLILSGLAWVATTARMGVMESGPGMYPEDAGFYLSVWVVMMAAMMLPSVWPTVGLYAQMRHERDSVTATTAATATFVAGYLLVWSAAGLLAFAALAAARSMGLDGLVWERSGHWVAAVVICLAAGYELTPLKEACLRRCRIPLGFLVSGWRDGYPGALRMGADHGSWCVGCCWALMASLFALGLMSLTWMLVVAVLIGTEKLLPWRLAGTLAVAAVLLALGVATVAAPGAFMS